MTASSFHPSTTPLLEKYEGHRGLGGHYMRQGGHSHVTAESRNDELRQANAS